MQKMNQTEAKALQADEDARQTGLEQLQNWGCMLRCESRSGPTWFKPSPMFKDITNRYPDEAHDILETYRADDAYLVMDLVNWLVTDEYEKVIAHLFYAESSTHSNASSTLKSYNTMLEKDGYQGIGPAKLRSVLTAMEIRIGTAVIMCQSDDSWRIITKEMAGK